MAKKPYHEDPALIKRLGEMTREQRLQWHASRAEKELLAEPRVVELLKADQTLKELRFELLHCREWQAQLEKMLALCKDPRYTTLRQRQLQAASKLSSASVLCAALLAQLLREFPQALTKTPLNSKTYKKCVDAVNAEEDALDELLEAEQGLEDLLPEFDVAFMGFLKAPAHIAGRSETFKRFSLKHLRSK
jgi:hypothetical protein